MENTLGARAKKDRRAEIKAADQRFMDAFSDGATTMGDLYTTDAHLFPPNSGVIEGNQAIGAFWKAVYGAGVRTATLEIIEAEQDGDLVIETGKYLLRGYNDKQLDTGKYLVVWKQEKGTWKLHRDIFNTSLPPES